MSPDTAAAPKPTAAPQAALSGTVSTKEHPKRRPGSKVTALDAPGSHGIALVLQYKPFTTAEESMNLGCAGASKAQERVQNLAHGHPRGVGCSLTVVVLSLVHAGS